jgi:hypothetical protein
MKSFRGLEAYNLVTATIVKWITKARRFLEGNKKVKLNHIIVPEKIRLGPVISITVSHSSLMSVLLVLNKVNKSAGQGSVGALESQL